MPVPSSLTRHSPISSLPPELLLAIFTCARDLTSTRDSPLFSIMQTCHLWRDLALNSPILFATITVAYDGISRRAFGRNALNVSTHTRESEAVERFLALSKECSITYQTESRRFDSTTSIPVNTRPLLEQAHRWKDVHLGAQSPHVYGDVRESYECPMLERLRLRSGHPGIWEWKQKIFSGSQTTRLREVEFNGQYRPTKFELPWGQLTKITLSGRMYAFNISSDVDEYIAILQRSKALVRFEAKWTGKERTGADPATRFVHHALKHLVLRDLTLLRFVEFPGLESLGLHYQYTSLRDQDARLLETLKIPQIDIKLADKDLEDEIDIIFVV